MSTFGNAPQQHQTEAASLRVKQGELLHREPYPKDKVIFREGHDGTDVYILESGRVGVFKMKDGKPVRLATLEKGAMFGEMSAVTGEKRSATTIAIEPSVIVRIPKSTIQAKLNSCDPFIKALINVLINNLSRVSDRYATTNVVAEKLLNELKTVQSEKTASEASETTAEDKTAADKTITDKTGPRGKDGGAP